MLLKDLLATTCPWCSSAAVKKDGHDSPLSQRFRCRSRGRTFTDRTTTPFAGHRWPLEVIVTAVRWYLLYRLSAPNVRDLLAERNIDVSARSVLKWVQKFGHLLAEEVRRQARPPRRRWYCDETYVRVAGRWAYLYRAVDQRGQVIDVLLRENRDLASARAFFRPSTGAERSTAAGGGDGQAHSLRAGGARRGRGSLAYSDQAAPSAGGDDTACRALTCAGQGSAPSDAGVAVGGHRSASDGGIGGRSCGAAGRDHARPAKAEADVDAPASAGGRGHGDASCASPADNRLIVVVARRWGPSRAARPALRTAPP